MQFDQRDLRNYKPPKHSNIDWPGILAYVAAIASICAIIAAISRPFAPKLFGILALSILVFMFSLFYLVFHSINRKFDERQSEVAYTEVVKIMLRRRHRYAGTSHGLFWSEPRYFYAYEPAAKGHRITFRIHYRDGSSSSLIVKYGSKRYELLKRHLRDQSQLNGL